VNIPVSFVGEHIVLVFLRMVSYLLVSLAGDYLRDLMFTAGVRELWTLHLFEDSRLPIG